MVWSNSLTLPRPGVRSQGAEKFGGKALAGRLVPVADGTHEKDGQILDVLDPFLEGGEMNEQGAESKEQVFAKTAITDHAVQITVGYRDQSEITVYFPVSRLQGERFWTPGP